MREVRFKIPAEPYLSLESIGILMATMLDVYRYVLSVRTG